MNYIFCFFVENDIFERGFTTFNKFFLSVIFFPFWFGSYSYFNFCLHSLFCVRSHIEPLTYLFLFEMTAIDTFCLSFSFPVFVFVCLLECTTYLNNHTEEKQRHYRARSLQEIIDLYEINRVECISYKKHVINIV